MMSEWTIFEIAEQVQLASRMSREVEDALSASDASLRVSVLLHEIGGLASAHERVLARLRDEFGPFDPALEIADKLADHWRLLSTALIAKMSELAAAGSQAPGVGPLPPSQPQA
jgi:hypothetical protein